MGNAYTSKSARYPLGDAKNFSAEFRLAEAAHALQQVPLDAVLLPVRVMQAQLHLLRSASRNICSPGNWTFLLQDVSDTPDIVFPACSRLIWALSHQSKTQTNQQDKTAQNAVVLEHLRGIQQVTGETNSQLAALTSLLQAQQLPSSSRSVQSQVSNTDRMVFCSFRCTITGYTYVKCLAVIYAIHHILCRTLREQLLD